MDLFKDSNGRTVQAYPTEDRYEVTLGDTGKVVEIQFQQGAVTSDNPVNGLTNEALIAILIDRLGNLNQLVPSEHNHKAIHSLRDAAHALNLRRMSRLVNGNAGTDNP